MSRRHDVRHGGDQLALHPDAERLLLVQMGPSLIAVKRPFVPLADRPDTNGDAFALARFDGGHAEVPGVPTEQQLIVVDNRGADLHGLRAAAEHLVHVQVAAISQVEFTVHVVLLSGAESEAKRFGCVVQDIVLLFERIRRVECFQVASTAH